MELEKLTEEKSTEVRSLSHLGPTFTRGEEIKFEAIRHVQAFILEDKLPKEKAIAIATRLILKQMTKNGVKLKGLDTLDRLREVLFMIHIDIRCIYFISLYIIYYLHTLSISITLYIHTLFIHFIHSVFLHD